MATLKPLEGSTFLDLLNLDDVVETVNQVELPPLLRTERPQNDVAHGFSALSKHLGRSIEQRIHLSKMFADRRHQLSTRKWW